MTPEKTPEVPCPTCPWRVGQDATTIPSYNHDLACDLMNTVGDEDGFRPIMACHHSRDGQEFPCLGYLAREGWRNLTVRLLLIRGECPNPSTVEAACRDRGIALEPDYPTVLAKLAQSCATEPQENHLPGGKLMAHPLEEDIHPNDRPLTPLPEIPPENLKRYFRQALNEIGDRRNLLAVKVRTAELLREEFPPYQIVSGSYASFRVTDFILDVLRAAVREEEEES